jgi:autotransporter translocation and assembly factor TamB
VLFLAMVPKELQPLGARSGFLSGKIDYSGTFEKPQINGGAQIFSASFNSAPPLPEVSNLTATLRIEKSQAAIAPFWFNASGVLFQGSGSLTITPPFFAFTFAPLENSVALARLPASGEEVSAIRVLGEGKVADGPIMERAIIRGKFGSPFFSLTMTSADPAQTTLFFNPQTTRAAGPLLLDVVRKKQASPALELRPAPPPEGGGD